MSYRIVTLTLVTAICVRAFLPARSYQCTRGDTASYSRQWCPQFTVANFTKFSPWRFDASDEEKSSIGNYSNWSPKDHRWQLSTNWSCSAWIGLSVWFESFKLAFKMLTRIRTVVKSSDIYDIQWITSTNTLHSTNHRERSCGGHYVWIPCFQSFRFSLRNSSYSRHHVRNLQKANRWESRWAHSAEHCILLHNMTFHINDSLDSKWRDRNNVLRNVHGNVLRNWPLLPGCEGLQFCSNSLICYERRCKIRMKNCRIISQNRKEEMRIEEKRREGKRKGINTGER